MTRWMVGGILLAGLVMVPTGTTREGEVTRGTRLQAPSADLVARGDSVFHGRRGGAICTTCHGQDAKGVVGMGPDLTDATWLHGDGSLTSLETIVRAGVPKPKKSALVMPPFGGVALDSANVTAVAAYVYSLSHR